MNAMRCNATQNNMNSEIEKVFMTSKSPIGRGRPAHTPRQANKPASRVVPFYFYAAGVLAAIAAAAVLVTAEMQGKTPAALNVADVTLPA